MLVYRDFLFLQELSSQIFSCCDASASILLLPLLCSAMLLPWFLFSTSYLISLGSLLCSLVICYLPFLLSYFYTENGK